MGQIVALIRPPWPVSIPYRDPGDAPVLFLDVDGVLIGYTSKLCSRLAMEPEFSRMGLFTPQAVKQVNRILGTTGAKVVISSMWRFDSDLMTNLLESSGVRFNGNLIGTTGMERTRGQEIREWLIRHPVVKRFVALDDDTSDMHLLGDRFVQTQWEVGLTKSIADKVIRKLSVGGK